MFQIRHLSFPVSRVLIAALVALFAISGVSAKTLRLNINADAKTLNPINNSELISGDVIKNIYETLTTLDKDGKVVPGLAVKWEGASDGRSFRFWLRKGVKFHSGREMTAADVKWTFEQVLTPAKKGGLMVDSLDRISGAKAMLEGKATSLAGFKIIDDHTFEVSFDSPSVVFPLYELYVVDSSVENSNGADWMQKVSGGTGPFKFASWQRGVAIKLAAHKDYWGGAPKVDGVDFLVVPNIETSISMYEANEIDLVTVPRAAVRRVLRDSRFSGELLQVPAAQVLYVGMNQNMYAPFKDARVRHALTVAIDRDAMVKGLYGGAAFPLYGQIAPGFPGYDPNTPKIPYDPDLAKKLLAEAGYPGGKGMPPVDIQGTPPNKTLLAYYADQFKKVLGMNVSVKVVERGTHIKAMNAGKVALFPWGWTADYADAASFLKDLYYSKSKWNRSRYSNPKYDGYIEKALTTANDADRFALYNKADRVLINDFGSIPTTVRMQVAIKKPNVKGLHLTAFRFMPFAEVEIQ